MSNLLSEQELRAKMQEAIRIACRKYEDRSQDSLQAIIDATDEVYKLSTSQKIAHANMVIGEDVPNQYSGDDVFQNLAHNNLRAEQRERNKL